MNTAKHVVTYDHGILIKKNGDYVNNTKVEQDMIRRKNSESLEFFLRNCRFIMDLCSFDKK